MVVEEERFGIPYVYIQGTEPADKTQGRIWYDTSINVTYVSDGTNYNLVGGVADGGVTTIKLSDNAVTTPKLSGNAVTIAKAHVSLAVSDDLIFSDNAASTWDAPASYTLAKQICVVTDTASKTSTIRIKFVLSNGNGSGTTEGKIYRNRNSTPTAVGTEQSYAAADWSGIFSEDIAGWEDGDIIELWKKTTSDQASSKDRRIYGTSGTFTPTHTLSFASP